MCAFEKRDPRRQTLASLMLCVACACCCVVVVVVAEAERCLVRTLLLPPDSSCA